MNIDQWAADGLEYDPNTGIFTRYCAQVMGYKRVVPPWEINYVG